MVATVLPKTRERKANWYIRPQCPLKKAVEAQIAAVQRREGHSRTGLRRMTIYKMWEDLLQMSDPKAGGCPAAQDRQL